MFERILNLPPSQSGLPGSVGCCGSSDLWEHSDFSVCPKNPGAEMKKKGLLIDKLILQLLLIFLIPASKVILPTLKGRSIFFNKLQEL